MNPVSGKHGPLTLILLSAGLLVLFFVSFTVGRYAVSITEILQVLKAWVTGGEAPVSAAVQTVVLKVRAPRILGAILIGGALSVCGAAYQGLFKNPMASPDILGASAGAGFGAAAAILMSFSFGQIQLMSFGFGLLATVLTYLISAAVSRGKDSLLILVLSGLVISTLFSSFITLIKYVADPFSKLPEITYWLMGSLNSVTSGDIRAVFIPIAAGILILLLLRWRLNALAFGDEEAKAMGINPPALRLVIILASTVLVAASVSISGMIGWVGLVIPHLARILTGPNFRTLMPASFLTGGIFLLGADNLVRGLFPVEIPLGILTSIAGAPFFVLLLLKRRKGWN